MSDIDYAKIHKEILEGGNVVFLGGAGVSTASGIPDFRSEAGLYHIKSKYGVPYEEMLSHHYFYIDNYLSNIWRSSRKISMASTKRRAAKESMKPMDQ